MQALVKRVNKTSTALLFAYVCLSTALLFAYVCLSKGRGRNSMFDSINYLIVRRLYVEWLFVLCKSLLMVYCL